MLVAWPPGYTGLTKSTSAQRHRAMHKLIIVGKYAATATAVRPSPLVVASRMSVLKTAMGGDLSVGLNPTPSTLTSRGEVRAGGLAVVILLVGHWTQNALNFPRVG